MATRLYFNNAGSLDPPAVSPAYSAGWEGTAEAFRLPVSTTKNLGGANGLSATTSGVANTDWLIVQGVSEPLDGAQTITGTVAGQFCVAEEAGTTNAYPQMRVVVVSGDGGTVRGVLFELTAAGLSHEFTSDPTFTNRSYPLGGAAAVSSVDAHDGDRVVFEVGFRTSAAVASFGEMIVSDSGDDLPVDETTTDIGMVCWVEFSQTLAFAGVLPIALLDDGAMGAGIV